MKAILVVDIPDDVKKSHADITIYEDKGEHRIIKRIAELKPLPQKKLIDYETFEEDGQKYAYEVGFNDCVNELVGEYE